MSEYIFVCRECLSELEKRDDGEGVTSFVCPNGHGVQGLVYRADEGTIDLFDARQGGAKAGGLSPQRKSVKLLRGEGNPDDDIDFAYRPFKLVASDGCRTCHRPWTECVC